jgi:hypothetical protein
MTVPLSSDGIRESRDEEYAMTALTTPVKLGGYALILLVVLAGGFGLGRAVGGDGRAGPAPHSRPAQHSQHSQPVLPVQPVRHSQPTEEQS